MKSIDLRGKIVALDTETTGLHPYLGDRIFGISIAVPGWSAYYDIREEPQVIDWLKEDLPKAKIIIGHHVKFDAHFLANESVIYDEVPWHCTMVTDALCYEHHHGYSLDDVAKRRLGRGKSNEMIEEWAKISGAKNKKQAMATLSNAPRHLVEKYALTDAEILIPTFFDQLNDIKDQNLEKVYKLEMELQPVLFNMERVGVMCDKQKAHDSIPMLSSLIESSQGELDDMVGFNVNVNSPLQIRKIFKPEKISKYQYRLNDGTICWQTDSGNPSIDQNVLKEMTHPAAALIRKIRKVIKLRDTFIKGHILSNIDDSNFVHTTFNSTRNDAEAGTVTGRLSSTDPALQQINGRDKDTSEILRSIFVVPDGYDWLRMDYSSADFRIASHYLNDLQMIAAYKENPNTDFHQFVADITNIPRSPEYAGGPSSKTLNLSMAFGAGAGKIAAQMGMPYSIEEWKDKMVLRAGVEATNIINIYHKKFPAFRKFALRASRVAKDRGYVMSLMGRRLRFINNDYHKAAGYLFQSGCAECMKTSLVRLYKMLKHTNYKLFLTVHDEVGIAAPQDGKLDDEIYCVYTDFESDESHFRLRVPMTASISRGSNWYDTK